jgi:hypothetical protein
MEGMFVQIDAYIHTHAHTYTHRERERHYTNLDYLAAAILRESTRE